MPLIIGAEPLAPALADWPAVPAVSAERAPALPASPAPLVSTPLPACAVAPAPAGGGAAAELPAFVDVSGDAEGLLLQAMSVSARQVPSLTELGMTGLPIGPSG
jgi:hypothetical protein